MGEFYFSVPLGDKHALCVAPLSDRRLAMSGQEVADPSGYFLYERRGSGELADVEIIARVVSEEAALRLRDMLKME